MARLHCILVIPVLFLLAGVKNHPANIGSPVFAVFTGTTPCGNMVRPLHDIPAQTDCAMIQWKLILYLNPDTHQPSSYTLSSTHHFAVKETNMYSQPGTSKETSGRWSWEKGSGANAQATVIRLNPTRQGKPVDLLQLNDRLLHVLDDNGNLAVGNPFWSYTLSRIDN